METDSSSGSPPPLPNPPKNQFQNTAISEAARTLGRASAKAIRGTPAAKKRASKAGKYSWSSRIKEAFEAGYQFGEKHELEPERAWQIWVTTKHGGLARLFGWAALVIAGLLLASIALEVQNNAIEKWLGLSDHSIEHFFQTAYPGRVKGPHFQWRLL